MIPPTDSNCCVGLVLIDIRLHKMWLPDDMNNKGQAPQGRKVDRFHRYDLRVITGDIIWNPLQYRSCYTRGRCVRCALLTMSDSKETLSLSFNDGKSIIESFRIACMSLSLFWPVKYYVMAINRGSKK